MKTLILMAIALVVGAAIAFSAANALAKRGAHQRAPMVMLAHHVDALKSMDNEAACTSEKVQAHLAQIASAAREIDFAYETQVREMPAFARRSENFRSLAEMTPAIASCKDVEEHLAQLGRSCQECHREFR